MTNNEYKKLADKASPPSPKVKDFIMAFVVGGIICVIGQLLYEVFLNTGMTLEIAGSTVSISLIVAAQILTGIGVFHKIAKHSGAGTLVPITGFANSIASPAIEFKSEGQVTGIGAKMFIIAGPVLVYGISASVLYGLVLWIFRIFV